MENRPIFSICHTTARPDGWRDSWAAWCALANRPQDVEYVLCVDRRWGFTPEMAQAIENEARSRFPEVRFRVVWNNGRKCMVDGYAFAAAASRGEILILNSDDMRPCEQWDWKLTNLLESPCYDFVIQVSSGTSADERDLMVLQILSRVRYERLGYVMYPGYDGVFADDDFSEHARHDGVVIKAKHLLFEHLHPVLDDTVDAVYKHQNRAVSYELGARLLAKRRANGFQDVAASGPTKIIATCTPGEVFSAAWVASWHQLQGQMLNHGYGLADWWGHSSNVYVTRFMMAKAVMEHLDTFSYVLWIDDDNLVNWEHVEKLIADLEKYPEISMVAGWCYIQPDLMDDRSPMVHSSVAYWIDQRFRALPIEELEKSQQLIEIDCTGFPVVLMRAETLKLAGEYPFNPRVGDQYEWGMTGEDVSFCLSLKERGGRIFVDPRVRVEHLKTRPVQFFRQPTTTTLPEAGQFEERTTQTV